MWAGVAAAAVVVAANRLVQVFLLGVFGFRRRGAAIMYCSCVQGVKMLFLALSFLIIFSYWPGDVRLVCLGGGLGSLISVLRVFISSH